MARRSRSGSDSEETLMAPPNVADSGNLNESLVADSFSPEPAKGDGEMSSGVVTAIEFPKAMPRRTRPFRLLDFYPGYDGEIIVSFSALKGDKPRYWFEDGQGLVIAARVTKQESSGIAGINLLEGEDITPSWKPSSITTKVAFGKNISEIWTLEGSDTYYLSTPAEEQGSYEDVSANLVDPITGGLTPVQSGRAHSFSILAAVHRCAAKVSLDCISADGNVLAHHEKLINTSFIGGTVEQDYDKISFRFTTPEESCAIRISIIKGPNTKAEDGFVFFTKPELVETPAQEHVGRVSKTMLELLKANPELQIFSATVPVPPDLLRGRREPVTLGIGIEGETMRVSDIDVNWNLPLEISACWVENADVLFRGVSTGRIGAVPKVGVFIDGEFSSEREIDAGNGPFESRITLDAKHLDGRPHAIELRLMPAQFCLASAFGTVASYLTPWEALQEYAKAPFSLGASPAATHHFRSYRAWAEHAPERIPSNFTRLNEELLQGFKKRLSYPKLEFPYVETPKVSIVIPVHNKFEVTYFCLCSLLFAFNNATYEVIITDDGSSDQTKELETFVAGVRVVRHAAAMGFVDSCNDGAAQSRGEFIFFLNNDTEVTAGFLDELLSVFENFDNVGLAGSKLLYPNGRLQEAGGIVWRSGNPWNVGRNGNPNEPQFCYLRQADYISGAAVMIPKSVWDEVKGFSQELAPAYFEDTDLAMKVRDSGRFVVYVPSSVVFHFEGQSAGTSTSSGMKRFQEINRPKFRRKWAKLYCHNGVEGVRPDLEKDRNVSTRVLMLDHAFPHVDSDAGSYAAFQEIRLLQSLGCKITFLPRNLAWMDRHTSNLEKIGVECLYAPFVMSIDNFLRDHAADFDLFFITRFRIADEFVPLIRRYAPAAKVMLNVADLHFLRELREAAAGSENYSFERAEQTRAAELRTIESVDLTLTYSDVEATVIQSHLMNGAKVGKVPWVVDVRNSPRPSFAETKDILFLGGFAHDPNRGAVKFFARSVIPRLKEKLPGVKFKIAGSRPPEDVLALQSEDVDVLGFVHDLDALFDSARVYVAPLLAGAGIKGKVVEGMAQGIPSVLSPTAAEGTGLSSGYDCLIAKTVDEWVDHVARLYTDETLWTSMGDAAKQGARDRFSFIAGQDLMREALAQVDIFAPRSGLYYKQVRP